MGHLPLGLPWFDNPDAPLEEDNRWLCGETCSLQVFRPGKGRCRQPGLVFQFTLAETLELCVGLSGAGRGLNRLKYFCLFFSLILSGEGLLSTSPVGGKGLGLQSGARVALGCRATESPH